MRDKKQKDFNNKDSLPSDTKVAKKPSGARNRRIGHDYERILCKEFREVLGFTKCKTSRQASRLLDDCKVDLYGIPFNVQAKSVRAAIPYNTILESMERLITEHMPERKDYPYMIFHKRQGKEVVVMSKEDLYSLLKLLVDKDTIIDSNK